MCLDPLVLLTCIHSFNYSSTQRWKGPIGSFPLIPYSINALLSQSNLQTHAINYFKLEYLAKITHSYLKTQKKCGRGALIKSNGNYFVGYWKNDKKNGVGVDYNKEGEIISKAEYKNGTLVQQIN